MQFLTFVKAKKSKLLGYLKRPQKNGVKKFVSNALSGENDDKRYNCRYTQMPNSDMQTIVSFFAVA
ncbi:hypothetical protein [Terrimonas pollutisoli]|uniref:hypothetical protein n=1 Tax=Terrimonas pollutisoli TaxID=3034147 RepID=UPI0023EC1706|nr:hypothetical protein [Terrimonas sp. H1YJ31]